MRARYDAAAPSGFAAKYCVKNRMKWPTNSVLPASVATSIAPGYQLPIGSRNGATRGTS